MCVLTYNSQSRAQPKSAAAVKATNGASTRGRARGRAGRRAGRPKRKTADELDAEMVDYFDADVATNGAPVDGAVNGTAQAAANDDGMDEISVSAYRPVVSYLLTITIVNTNPRKLISDEHRLLQW